MKLPSFVRLPRHRQFNYEPKFYDPVQDELKERIKLIQSEMAIQNNEATQEDRAMYAARISEAFKTRTKYHSSLPGNTKVILLRIVIACLLIMFFSTYWLYGNKGLTVLGLWVLGLALLYFMMSRKRKH